TAIGVQRVLKTAARADAVRKDDAMRASSRLTWLAAFAIVALPGAASAQWLDYPTSGVPRTADGKPDIAAPAPRTADGRPDRIVILTERNMQYRQIFTDGRPLPVDPNPTWNGYSTATWDGDTLVVQTIGFKDDLWLDASGNPLTDAGKLTERIRRPNYGTLEVSMTIDDPKSYTAPWTVKLTQP